MEEPLEWKKTNAATLSLPASALPVLMEKGKEKTESMDPIQPSGCRLVDIKLKKAESADAEGEEPAGAGQELGTTTADAHLGPCITHACIIH